MTKKSDKASLSNNPPQLFVYGLDEAGKPKGARFSISEMETVGPVIAAQKLQFFEGHTEELANLGMKLAVGRIYARGKSFIPNIKRDLHDQIHAEVVRSKKEFERSRAEQVAASPAAPEGDSAYCNSTRRCHHSAAVTFGIAAELGVDCGRQHGSGGRRPR